MRLARFREESESFAERTVRQTAQMLDTLLLSEIDRSVNEIRNVKYLFFSGTNR